MALIEGCFNLYRENKYSDLTLITIDKKHFNCHKFVLGAVSNIFEKKFFEDKEENIKEIGLEITSDLLSVVINYIYRDQLKIDSENVAIELYKFAFKYEFKKLMVEVKKYISENLITIRSSLKCLTTLNDCGMENILDRCKKVVMENVDKVIESEEFLDCPLELVVELISLDKLNISELDLFNRVQNWMDHKKELEGGGENLKLFYRELVRNIRFLTMTQTEFLGSPFNSYLLSKDDKMSFISNICIPNSAPLPEGFSTKRQKRGLFRELNKNICKPNPFKNIVAVVHSALYHDIKWKTLNVSKLNFNCRKEYVSPIMKLYNNRDRCRIIMKLNMDNYEKNLTIGLQNCNENSVCLRSFNLYIKNSKQNFEYFRQFQSDVDLKLAKNKRKELEKISFKEITDKGCLIEDSLEFKVYIGF